jgi:hypothetical protein
VGVTGNGLRLPNEAFPEGMCIHVAAMVRSLRLRRHPASGMSTVDYGKRFGWMQGEICGLPDMISLNTSLELGVYAQSRLADAAWIVSVNPNLHDFCA